MSKYELIVHDNMAEPRLVTIEPANDFLDPSLDQMIRSVGGAVVKYLKNNPDALAFGDLAQAMEWPQMRDALELCDFPNFDAYMERCNVRMTVHDHTVNISYYEPLFGGC